MAKKTLHLVLVTLTLLSACGRQNSPRRVVLSDYGLTMELPPGWTHERSGDWDYAYSSERVMKTPVSLIVKKGAPGGKAVVAKARAAEIAAYADGSAVVGSIVQCEFAGKQGWSYSIEKFVTGGTQHDPGGPQVTRALITRYYAEDGSIRIETTLPLDLRDRHARSLTGVFSSLTPVR
jgi:hypothetical protein